MDQKFLDAPKVNFYFKWQFSGVRSNSLTKIQVADFAIKLSYQNVCRTNISLDCVEA